MKSIILTLLLLLGATSAIHAIEPIRKPSWLESFEKPEPLKRLEKLLVSQKVKEFYLEVEAIRKEYSLPAEQPVTEQKLKEHFYLRYLVTLAPLLGTDNFEDVEWLMNKSNLDIWAKFREMGSMSPKILNQPDFNQQFKPSRNEYINLYFSTQATIIRQFKQLYNPNIKKWKQEKENYFMENLHLFPNQKSTYDYFNTVNIIVSRNYLVENRLKYREKQFIEWLINFYPKSASKVLQIIQQAGYEKKEIPALLDRTERRTARAEYLYKILPKRTLKNER